MAAQAPNIFESEGGERSSLYDAGATIAPCKGLDITTDGTLILATNTRKSCVGIATNTYASGDKGIVIHKGGCSRVLTTGTVKAGDHLRVSATAGVFEADSTSGSTVQSSDSILIARQDADANGYCMARWIR